MKKNLFIPLGVVAVIGLFALMAFSGGLSDKQDTYSMAEDNRSDLASMLETAVDGEIIVLEEDTELSRNATVRSGVTLNDGGFSLTIKGYAILIVEGDFISSGDLEVELRGSITVTAGGTVSIDNEGHVANIFGSLEVYEGGTINIGLNESSSLECLAYGRLMIEGTMVLGHGILNSYLEVRTATLTGSLQISDGSSFKIIDSLTIGNAPTLIDDMNNAASITGKVILDSNAYVLVYGNSIFKAENIKYSSTSTKFLIQNDKIYATEYKDNTSKRTIVLPSTSGLRDYSLLDWQDSNGNIISSDNNIIIGSIKAIYANLERHDYRIVFVNDPSIKWVISGIDRGSSYEMMRAYGDSVTISVKLASGYTELPSIFIDGVPFTAGTSFKVTGDTIFTTSNNYPSPDDGSVVPILLAVLAILAVVLAIFVVALRMKNQKKE